MPGDYIKCPRCELNYIHKSQEYCDVCKAELKLGPQLVFAVDEDDDAMELCPICKSHYIKYDEEMCASCREEMDLKKDAEPDEDDDGWRDYLDEDKEEPLETDEEMLSLSKLAEEEADELFDDEEEEEEIEEYDSEPDDFEIPEIDASDFEDYDEEDEEDEDDDDE